MKNIKRPYEAEARHVCEAIRQFREHPERLDNFEIYLSHHFGEWLQKWANTPACMAEEFDKFSHDIYL